MFGWVRRVASLESRVEAHKANGEQIFADIVSSIVQHRNVIEQASVRINELTVLSNNLKR